MKRMTLAALAFLIATPAISDPVLGLYKARPGDDGKVGHGELYRCGASGCGVIRKAIDASGAEIPSDNIGRRMIWNMQAQGDGAYGKGKIWAPDRDKTYSSKMELSGNALKVSGCVLGICRAQNWTRVK